MKDECEANVEEYAGCNTEDQVDVPAARLKQQPAIYGKPDL